MSDSYLERLQTNNDALDAAEEITEALLLSIEVQETKLAELEAAIAEKTSGPARPNIFAQLEEPSSKNGIWLQTDKEVEYYIADDNVYTGGEWNMSKMTELSSIPISVSNSMRTILLNNLVYIFYTNGVYVYDINTDTYTNFVSNLSYNFVSGVIGAINDKIYLMCSNYSNDDNARKVIEYNTITHTFTEKYSNTQLGLQRKAYYYMYNNWIYVFGSSISRYDKLAFRYNPLNNELIQLSNSPVSLNRGYATGIDDNIYLFGNANSENYYKVYKYSIVNDTYTRLSDIPFAFYDGEVIAVGSDIYLFGSSWSDDDNARTLYKYNTILDTYTKLDNSQYVIAGGNLVYINGEIYCFGGNASSSSKVKVLSLTPKEYLNKSIVISQGSSKYKTKLFNSDITNGIDVNFNNVFYYTTQSGVDGSIPSYYGDGTQWINFKNPPEEEVEE